MPDFHYSLPILIVFPLIYAASTIRNCLNPAFYIIGEEFVTYKEQKHFLFVSILNSSIQMLKQCYNNRLFQQFMVFILYDYIVVVKFEPH